MIFEGARDMEPLAFQAWPAWVRILLAATAAITMLALFLLMAQIMISTGHAQQSSQFSNCSQTVGATSAAVAFPTSGETGPAAPTSYLEICNAHASNTLGVRAIGGTAAIGAAGTLTLNPGGCLWWSGLSGPVPANVAIIGSAGSTVTACWYK